MPNSGIFSITRANLKVFTMGNDRNPIKDLLAIAQTLRRCFSFDWKSIKGLSWATWTLPKPSISKVKQYKQKRSFCKCTVLPQSDPVKAERWVPSVFFSQHHFLPLIFLHFFSKTSLNGLVASFAWLVRSGVELWLEEAAAIGFGSCFRRYLDSKGSSKSINCFPYPLRIIDDEVVWMEVAFLVYILYCTLFGRRSTSLSGSEEDKHISYKYQAAKAILWWLVVSYLESSFVENGFQRWCLEPSILFVPL